jgi:hypothetical protein
MTSKRRRIAIIACAAFIILCLSLLIVMRKRLACGDACRTCPKKAAVIAGENHQMAVSLLHDREPSAPGANPYIDKKQIPNLETDENNKIENTASGVRGRDTTPERISADGSPYLNGPVVLQNAKLGDAARLLSEAAGGANILVESALIEQSAASAANGAGITMTLANISFEDALSALTAANGWTWRREAGVYMITTRETANAGINALSAATVNGRTTVPITVSIYRPKGGARACDLLPLARTAVPDTICDPEKNTLLMRGREKDVARANQILNSNVE